MLNDISRVPVECVIGDIASQEDMEVVVNAANAELESGGGVAGALHKVAGPELAEECRHLAPIEPGEAVITGAYDLPNKFVIHCLGPVYGVDKPEDLLLVACYRNALRLAEKNKIESIAFPAISTGAFGFPMKDAAKLAFRTIKEMIPELKNVQRIRFVLPNKEALDIHENVLNSL